MGSGHPTSAHQICTVNVFTHGVTTFLTLLLKFLNFPTVWHVLYPEENFVHTLNTTRISRLLNRMSFLCLPGPLICNSTLNFFPHCFYLSHPYISQVRCWTHLLHVAIFSFRSVSINLIQGVLWGDVHMCCRGCIPCFVDTFLTT